jgi:hypothetical protein
MKEIRDRFAVRAIRAVNLRNPVWKLANCSKPAEGDLETLFAGVKQMEGIDDDKYWVKRPPWKQPKYDRDKKSHEVMQKLKSTLHLASRGEWQLDYETQGELRQHYSTTQRELYGGKYPNPLKSYMSTLPRHEVFQWIRVPFTIQLLVSRRVLLYEFSQLFITFLSFLL